MEKYNEKCLEAGTTKQLRKKSNRKELSFYGKNENAYSEKLNNKRMTHIKYDEFGRSEFYYNNSRKKVQDKNLRELKTLLNTLTVKLKQINSRMTFKESNFDIVRKQISIEITFLNLAKVLKKLTGRYAIV